ncbi:MAG: hypothetical protein HGA47_14070, partial [Zoogloea sp.]|nr:hypothetical protein [Zoogloea sp.]
MSESATTPAGVTGVGRPRQAEGRLMVPMYHPAAALHQPSLRRIVEQDFSRIPGLLEQASRLAPLED